MRIITTNKSQLFFIFSKGYQSGIYILFQQCGRTRRGAADESMYSDIAVVSSVKIIIDERDEVQVEQIAEIEPFTHSKTSSRIFFS